MIARFAVLLALTGLASPVWAESQGAQLRPAVLDTFKAETPAALRPETYRLWQGEAPLTTAATQDQVPTLTVVRPMPGRGNGGAIVIVPGGAYIAIATPLEGAEPAAWFASRGITAFVLTYRVRPAVLPAPLLDGARAIRFVRANAAALQVDPARIGMMGFSAGGHLAASVASSPPAGDPAAPDPFERVSSRPDYLVLAYPWLEATRVTAKGTSHYCDFAATVKLPCKPADFAGYDPLPRVGRNMPPTFIYHTTDDELVPVRGSLAFYEALVDAGADAEFHAFASGRHGSGMGTGTSRALARWPELLDEWLRVHGVLAKGAAPN